MVKMKSKFIIQQDDREPNLQVLADTLELGIVFERIRLNEGDYIVDDVCIERKEINDFCGSIIDGRLEKQIEKMKVKYKKIFILISGRIKDRTSEIDENCVVGMIVSLLIKHNIPVLIFDDDFQLIFAMKRLFERSKLQEVNENGNK